MVERTACAKAQRRANSGGFGWGEDGACTLVGKEQRVFGAPESPSDVGLL